MAILHPTRKRGAGGGRRPGPVPKFTRSFYLTDREWRQLRAQLAQLRKGTVL